MPKFEVRSVDWDESWDDAIEISEWDMEDAVDAWCRYKDGQGSWEGVYPQGHIVEVRSEDGVVDRFRVSTDWDPSFFVSRA